MATNNSAALAATYAIQQAMKQSTGPVPLNSNPLGTFSHPPQSSLSVASTISSTVVNVSSGLSTLPSSNNLLSVNTAHPTPGTILNTNTGLSSYPSMTGLSSVYPAFNPNNPLPTMTGGGGGSLHVPSTISSSSSSSSGNVLYPYPPGTVLIPGTVPSSTPTIPTSSSSSATTNPTGVVVPPVPPPTIPTNLVTQAQQISNRNITTPILPNIPSSIPLQLMDRVTGKARIRSMAKYFDPSIELEEGAVELIDELMGKLIDDWTFMAANIARIRTTPSTDSGLPLTNNSSISGMQLSSGSMGTGSVAVPIGTGINGGHPVLEATDYHAYIAQVYPYLTLPTENITSHIPPKAPPAYASMESLVAKQRLALLTAALTTDTTVPPTTNGIATTVSASSTGNGVSGAISSGSKITGEFTNIISSDNADAMGRSGGEGSKSTVRTGNENKPGKDTTTPIVRSTALSLKKRGRPPKNPALIKLNGGGTAATGTSSSTTGATATTTGDGPTGTTSGDKSEPKKVSLVLGKSPSFSVAGSTTTTTTTTTGSTVVPSQSTSTNSATGSSTTTTTSTGPRLLLRIGGPKPPSSSSS